MLLALQFSETSSLQVFCCEDISPQTVGLFAAQFGLFTATKFYGCWCMLAAPVESAIVIQNRLKHWVLKRYVSR